MFLDPEPRRHTSQTRSPTRTPSPIESLYDPRTNSGKPLQERSRSQINVGSAKRDPSRGRGLQKPTVRLVRQTPSVPASIADSEPGIEDLKTAIEYTIQKYERAQPRTSTAAAMEDDSLPKQGSGKATQDDDQKGLSELPSSKGRAPKLEFPPSVTLLPTSSHYTVPSSAWHRRNGSSGNYSTSPTLHDIDTSLAQSNRRSERLSQGTTLRGTPTPTPTEKEHRERFEADRLAQQDQAHALQTLEEMSPERATVRAVPPSIQSSASERQLQSGHSESSLQANSSPTDSEGLPVFRGSDSPTRGRSVSGPWAPAVDVRDFSAPGPRSQPSLQSFADSEASLHRPSSPVVVVYNATSSNRPRLLNYSPSMESIESRLQGPAVLRPNTSESLAHSNSWTSLQPSSSNDTLPPLRIPRRRLRHTQGSLSLGFVSDEDEYDTLPYARRQHSAQLSTIASEGSRSASQLLGNSSLARTDGSSSVPPDMSSEEELGDMTLDIYRDESAKPLPLFKKQLPKVLTGNKKYSGPLPPMPPIPRSRDSDEDFDMVTELQSPVLRPQRSGYSIRKRSNSSPSHSRGVSLVSYGDSERTSDGSNLFPVWVKHFYSGTIDLTSTVSLASLSPAGLSALADARRESQVTEWSNMSEYDIPSRSPGSPASRRFFPIIFRPRNRIRARTEGPSHRFRSWRSRDNNSSIFTEAPCRVDTITTTTTTSADSQQLSNSPPSIGDGYDALPRASPKWGKLRDRSSSHEQHRPLPRQYSQQRHWDGMAFPRPMTKDRPSNFSSDLGFYPRAPYLAPSKRASQRPLSMFRPPSLTESIDRCFASRVTRQITLFVLGFLCPLCWMLAAVLPLPPRPLQAHDLEKAAADGQTAMMTHATGDAMRLWREETEWSKARWWRALNRIMSIVGLGVIGAVVSLVFPPSQTSWQCLCRLYARTDRRLTLRHGRLRLPSSRRDDHATNTEPSSTGMCHTQPANDFSFVLSSCHLLQAFLQAAFRSVIYACTT